LLVFFYWILNLLYVWMLALGNLVKPIILCNLRCVLYCYYLCICICWKFSASKSCDVSFTWRLTISSCSCSRCQRFSPVFHSYISIGFSLSSIAVSHLSYSRSVCLTLYLKYVVSIWRLFYKNNYYILVIVYYWTWESGKNFIVVFILKWFISYSI